MFVYWPVNTIFDVRFVIIFTITLLYLYYLELRCNIKLINKQLPIIMLT